MAKSRHRGDETFETYLRRSRMTSDARDWARIYVEGFNAARSDSVSRAGLLEESAAAGKIDGDRTFRIAAGYHAIPTAIYRSLNSPQSTVQLAHPVTRVKWRPGAVEVSYRSPQNGKTGTLHCRQLIVTVPLGVLQAGPGDRDAIEFDPRPVRPLDAAGSLRFGQVYRVSFRFRAAFWEEDRKLVRAGFMVSQEPTFFTWWTTYPMVSPILTGWMAGTAAEQFQATEPSEIAAAALLSLRRILKRKVPVPEAIYFHDWRRDPCFRGAYSYVPAHSRSARRVLAQPVERTLFFAGEATDYTGHGATVHGAIASGIRAARQAMEMVKV